MASKPGSFPAPIWALQVDAGATAQRAYQLGRKPDLLAALQEQWQLLRRGADLTPVLTVGEAQVADLLNRIAQTIDRPAHDATVTIQGLEVITTPAQVGRDTDLQATWGGRTSAGGAGWIGHGECGRS